MGTPIEEGTKKSKSILSKKSKKSSKSKRSVRIIDPLDSQPPSRSQTDQNITKTKDQQYLKGKTDPLPGTSNTDPLNLIKPQNDGEQSFDPYAGQPPPSRHKTEPGFSQAKGFLPGKSKSVPPGLINPSASHGVFPDSSSNRRGLPSKAHSLDGYESKRGRDPSGRHSKAQSLPPMHLPISFSRLSNWTIPLTSEFDNTSIRDGSIRELEFTPRSNPLPPIISPRADIGSQIPLPKDNTVVSLKSTVGQTNPREGQDVIKRDVGESPIVSLLGTTSEKVIQTDIKEPRHPRNIYINKKLSELESITRSLKHGPWDDTGPWGEPIPGRGIIKIEGPYTLDEIIYEDEQEHEDDYRLSLNTNQNLDIKKGREQLFDMPSAYDPEKHEVKEELAKAAALLSSIQADPTESILSKDPALPGTCDCCKDMNEHNKYLAETELENIRPKIMHQKKKEESLNKPEEALGYYRSESPVLVSVKQYVDKDLASEEMLKVGVAKELVQKLRDVARPQDLSVSQIPWPFYAHDMSDTTDLTQYLESGLPTASDTILKVNVGEANSRYKDSFTKLEKMVRKFNYS